MDKFFDKFELNKRNGDVENLEKIAKDKSEHYLGFIDTREIDKKIEEKIGEMDKKNKEIKVIEELILSEGLSSGDVYEKLDSEMKVLYNEFRLLDDERKKLEVEKDSLIGAN